MVEREDSLPRKRFISFVDVRICTEAETPEEAGIFAEKFVKCAVARLITSGEFVSPIEPPPKTFRRPMVKLFKTTPYREADPNRRQEPQMPGTHGLPFVEPPWDGTDTEP